MNLLTGVTGKVGAHLLDQLSAFDMQTRVLVRDPSKLPSDLPQLDVITGSLDSPDLDIALQNVDKALILLSNSPQQKELECHFINRAKAAGVRHIVKISAIGADANADAILKQIHGEIEDHLVNCGVTYTIIRPNFFMQNLLTSAGTIAQQSAFYMPMGEAQVGIVDAADVASMALQVLSTPGHENKTYELSGPSLLTFAEIAQVMSKVLGREISYVDIPNASLREAMRNVGVDNWHVSAVGELFELTKSGASASVSNSFEQVVGRRPTSLETYLEANRAAYGKAD